MKLYDASIIFRDGQMSLNGAHRRKANAFRNRLQSYESVTYRHTGQSTWRSVG